MFEGGKKVAIQRGGGMITAKSTLEKEKAAAVFLKWFTAPEQNMRLVASTGYLPVTHEAFDNIMAGKIPLNQDDKNINKLLQTAIKVYQEYDFYIPPVFDDFSALSETYDTDLEGLAVGAREEYLKLLGTLPREKAYEQAVQGDFEAFVSGR